MIDDAGDRRRSADEREVPLLDRPFLECAREHFRRVLRSCEEERAARPAIEAMHGMHVLPAERVAYAEHRDVVVVVPTTVYEQAGRLVHDDYVRVDEEEIHPVRTSYHRRRERTSGIVLAGDGFVACGGALDDGRPAETTTLADALSETASAGSSVLAGTGVALALGTGFVLGS